jgi:hypothetical protein
VRFPCDELAHPAARLAAAESARVVTHGGFVVLQRVFKNPTYAVCPRCHVLCAGHTDAARQTARIKPGFSMPCDFSPDQGRAAAVSFVAIAVATRKR